MPHCRFQLHRKKPRGSFLCRPHNIPAGIRIPASTRKVFSLSHTAISSLLDEIISDSSNIDNMDSDIKKLAMLLMFQLSLFSLLECIAMDEFAIFLGHWQQLCCMTLALHAFKRCSGRRRRRLWAHDRGLLGSFNEREFKG